MTDQETSERKIFIGYAVDVFGPLAAYWLTRKLGISVFWGLALGSAIAITSTAPLHQASARTARFCNQVKNASAPSSTMTDSISR